MSYILDALKKAERDRGITKVPALLAVHDLRPQRRTHLWAILVSLPLCVVGLYWVVTTLRTSVPLPARHAAAEQSQSGTAGPVPASPETAEPNSSAAVAQPQPESKPTPVRQLETAALKPHDQTTPVNPPEQTQSRQSRETAAVVSPPPTAPEARPAPVSPAATPVPTPAAPKGTPVSLKEAVAGMNMTVLVYAETKAERLVFINGRKYVEGDYVDEIYLLEAIRPDEAVLSYGAERAVLRPGGAR